MSDEADEPVMTGLERMKAHPRSTEELIATALDDLHRWHEDSDAAEGYPSAAVLHARGTRDVLDAALGLCDSMIACERELGALILGQLGSPARTFPEECCDRLLRFLECEEDIDVLEMTLFAFGHLHNRRADPEVVKFTTHPNDRIRHGAAVALGGTTHPEAVKALLELMRDPYVSARDWATTSIGGTVELDGPEIREALLERIDDWDKMTRGEAHLGLARRRDERSLPYLIAELEQQFAPKGRDQDTNCDYYFRDAAKIFLDISDEEDIPAEQLVGALGVFVALLESGGE